MQAIAITYKGLEPVVIQDLTEILGVTGHVHSPGRVLYDATEEQIAQFTYFCRSISGSYLLLGSCEVSLAALERAFSAVDVPYMDATFKVRCLRRGTHEFSSVTVERHVGAYLAGKYLTSVDLEDPHTVVLVDIVDDVCLFGIDFARISLQKREWRVKTLAQSLNACLVYGALRYAGYAGEGVVFDPYVGDGATLIEACLSSCSIPSALRFEELLQCFKFLDLDFSVPEVSPSGSFIGFDPQLGHLQAVQVNSKLAGVHSFFSLSRQDVSWIDLKVPADSVDCVVTRPYFPGIHISPVTRLKLYEELLSRLAVVLRSTGKICLICDHPAICQDALTSVDLNVFSTCTVTVGKSVYTLLVLHK